jgi:hypothetical protein
LLRLFERAIGATDECLIRQNPIPRQDSPRTRDVPASKRRCGYVKQHNETRGLDYRADVRCYLFVMFASSFTLRRIKRLRASNLFTASPESRSVNRLAKRK